MSLNSVFTHKPPDIKRDIMFSFQKLMQDFPYNRYLGQTPVSFVEHGVNKQLYKSVQNDTTFEQLDDFVYKWICPEVDNVIISVDSIINLRTNKQYYPIDITNSYILFSIQPDDELNFSYAVQDRDKFIDDVLISYNYTNYKFHIKTTINTVLDPAITNLEILPVGSQTLAGQIIFESNQYDEITINKEKLISTMYILSKSGNQLHLYRFYIPCEYSKEYYELDMAQIETIQNTGQQSTLDYLTKLTELDITGETSINITSAEFDIPDLKIRSVQLSCDEELINIPDETLIWCIQQFPDKLEW